MDSGGFLTPIIATTRIAVACHFYSSNHEISILPRVKANLEANRITVIVTLGN